MTDEELAKQLQAGDEKALSELIFRYQNKLFYYVLKLINSRDDSEDVVQEVFLKVYQNIQSFDVERKFSSWIYRIAHNQAINVAKKRSRLKAVEVETLDWLVEQEKEIVDFLDIEKRNELTNEMMKYLKTLRPEFQEVVVLYFFEEKTYEEISDILQIPQTTVGVWLNRAKSQLKKKLKEHE